MPLYLRERILKRAASHFSKSSGGNRLLTLIYHRVFERPDPLLPDIPDGERFDWQMELLARNFNVLSMDEAVAGLAENSLPERAVCITFDDGYADNYRVALPILRKYGLPATFFIATGYLNGGRMWNDDIIEAVRTCESAILDLSSVDLGIHTVDTLSNKQEVIKTLIKALKHRDADARVVGAKGVADCAEADLPENMMLSSDELIALHRAGMEIGGHTRSHPILANLSREDALREIDAGKSELEALLGGPVNYFAYPNGKLSHDFTHKDVDIVRELGFRAAFSTQWGVANGVTDPWMLPRFTPWDNTPGRFQARMSLFYRNLWIH